MNYSVFIGEKEICFSNDQINQNEHDSTLILYFFTSKLTIHIVDILEKNQKVKKVFICVDDVAKTFQEFQNHFKLIKAAGGVVTNEKNEYLFIYRLDKWDLPKGKVKKNEGIEDAAIREVQEECGISNLEVERIFDETYHIYSLKEKVVLKHTYWFKMSSNYQGKLIPQEEESIREACWLSKNQITEKVLPNTYASITKILKKIV